MCTVYAAHALGIITRSLVRTITYHKENCVCIKKTQNKVEVDKHRVDTTPLWLMILITVFAEGWQIGTTVVVL